MHQVDALAALLVAAPESGPPGSPNLSPRFLRPPPGGAAASCSITSVTSAGYNACSAQMVSDVDGVIALDGAAHSINDSVLDPDHAGADARVVAQRQALDSLDRHSCRRGELHWDWDRQCRAGIADGLDRGFQLWRDAGLRQQVVLELHDRHLRRRGDWRGRFADDHLWEPRLGDVCTGGRVAVVA